MKNSSYEIYYNDGGHCGPFGAFKEAYEYALRILKGGKTTTRIELRPRHSQAIGGYSPKNTDSFYVSKCLRCGSLH